MSDKLIMWFDVAVALGLVTCAALFAPNDLWVRVDGWLAIACAVSAVASWYRLERGAGNGR